MLKLNFSSDANGSRAVFNRALQSDSRVKEGVVTTDTLGTFFDAVHEGIEAERLTGKYKDAKASDGGEYTAAAKVFFALNKDVHEIYVNHEPPTHHAKHGSFQKGAWPC